MGATSTRRLTRTDREAVRRAAASANAQVDLRPVGRAALVVAVVITAIVVIALLVPDGRAFGGPLQSDRLQQGSSLTAVRTTEGRRVTFGLPVPWNAGSSTVELQAVVPLDAEGVDVVRAAVVTLGQPAVPTRRGFPPPAAVLEDLESFPVPPGTGTLDGFQIVVGLAGRGSVSAFALVYRAGDARYVAILGHGAVLCPRACDDLVEAAEARQRKTLDRLSPFVAAPSR